MVQQHVRFGALGANVYCGQVLWFRICFTKTVESSRVYELDFRVVFRVGLGGRGLGILLLCFQDKPCFPKS